MKKTSKKCIRAAIENHLARNKWVHYSQIEQIVRANCNLTKLDFEHYQPGRKGYYPAYKANIDLVLGDYKRNGTVWYVKDQKRYYFADANSAERNESRPGKRYINMTNFRVSFKTAVFNYLFKKFGRDQLFTLEAIDIASLYEDTEVGLVTGLLKMTEDGEIVADAQFNLAAYCQYVDSIA